MFLTSARRAASRRSSFRPEVQPLEDRCVPSTLRTLAFHEITSLDRPYRSLESGGGPILSALGNAVAFQEGADDNLNVYVTDANGSDPVLVDSFPCYQCGGHLDISADGSKVIWTDSFRLRSADHLGSQELVRVAGNEIWDARIAGDGTAVFFKVRRDTARQISETEWVPMSRGVYVINPDGTGLSAVVTPQMVGGALGVDDALVFPFSGSGGELAVSWDGFHIVFGTAVDGLGGDQRLLSYDLNTTELRELELPPHTWIVATGISGDGSTVSYSVNLAPCCSSPNEAGVMNFDGSGRRALAVSNDPLLPSGFPFTAGDRVSLTFDGSLMMLGGTSVVINTATEEKVQLAARTGWHRDYHTQLVTGGMRSASMNAFGTGFVFLAYDSRLVLQLVRLDVSPKELGDAPWVVDATVDPEFVVAGGAPANVSAWAFAAYGPVRVGSATLRDGLYDRLTPEALLLDDETGFFSGRVGTFREAVPGPRVLRVQAEVVDAVGRRHTTAVDFEPFEVLAPGDSPGPGGSLPPAAATLSDWVDDVVLLPWRGNHVGIPQRAEPEALDLAERGHDVGARPSLNTGRLPDEVTARVETGKQDDWLAFEIGTL